MYMVKCDKSIHQSLYIQDLDDDIIALVLQISWASAEITVCTVKCLQYVRAKLLTEYNRVLLNK